MKLLTTFGLILGLIAAILLAFSLNIQESDMGGLRINVQEVNGEIVSQAKFSYVAMRPVLFYSGIFLLILGFLLQLIGLFKEK
ncbi:hypothetical protein GOV12_07545 [Candidatus Pacearchaeota archaeon]|nr:hypothetical protein [Candidatus Pacearchaeota archaeon]